jgi:hypothetical protein
MMLFARKLTILMAIGFLEKLLRQGDVTPEQEAMVRDAQRLLIRADDAQG